MNVHSIRFRLVAWYAGLLTVIFMIICALLFLDLRRFLEHELRQRQFRRAHQVATTLVAHIPQISEDTVARQVKDWYEPEANDRFIRIIRQDGTLVYRSQTPGDGSFDASEVPLLPAHIPAEFSQVLKLSDGKTLLLASLSVPVNKTSYRVEFGELLDPVETMLDHVFLQLTLAFPVAILIIAFGGYLLVTRALRPVERIAHAAEQITQHNLKERLPIAHTGDELERLSASLNRMITRLDDAFQQTNRFLADASHELRTPLTVLCGELEEFTTDDRLEVALRERTASLLEEALRLSKIVEQLFLLSRLDAGEAKAEWSQFDLADLVRTTAEQMSLLAEDKEIAISGEAPERVMIEGDRARLKQVVVNLLDNAIKYTRKRGAIKWAVHNKNSHAVLEISDTGIGIPADAVPHIFERFYRVDTVRSGDAESAGLGLSIVKSICVAHDASIEVKSSLGQGSVFSISLPAANAAASAPDKKPGAQPQHE